MLRAERVERSGHWPSERARGTVTLAFDDRHRRRLRLTSDAGEAFLLDLSRARVLEEGDGLALSDGTWLAVRAAPEALLEITAPEPSLLLRLAWHLGNRHLPTDIRNDALRIRPDHVIEDMLRGFGAALRKIEAPFQPEGGAYGGHNHDHSHDES
jgi:urease accessory protein